MLKSVTITNPKGEKLVLELSRPEKSGLIVHEITGLGPSKANINSTEMATMDGSIYNSARQENRNIVFTLGMMFAPTIEDSRQKTYHFFPIKKKIKMEFKTTNRDVQIYGYVESNEPDIFSKEESTQISVICPDPSFYDVIGNSETFSIRDPLFEFPFLNDDVAGDLIEFGNISYDTRAIVKYHGDSDCGMLITIHAMDEVRNLIINNVDSGEVMRINTDVITKVTGVPFGSGDDLVISTIKGDKYAQLLREGRYYNVIGAIDKDSDWFQLSVGDNIFAYGADGDGEQKMSITFFYKTAFGGI